MVTILTKMNVEQIFDRAKSLEKKGRTKEAYSLYIQVLYAYPKNIRAKNAIEHFKNLKINYTNQHPPSEVINELLSLFNNGQFSTVTERTQALTNHYPKAFMLWNILGVSAYKTHMLDKAIKACKKAILIKPDYAEAYNNMGVALKDIGKVDEAIRIFNKAILIKPDYVEAYNNLGNAYKDKYKPEEAIKAYKRAISLKPDYAEAYNNLGNSLNDLGRFEEAIEYINKSILLKPNYVLAFNNLGVVLSAQGKLNEAVVEFKKALLLNPNYADANNNLGNIFYELGDFKSAISYFKFALSIDPNFVEALNNLGKTFVKQNYLVEAIQCFNNSLSIRPQDEIIRAKKIHLLSQICDWKSIEKDKNLIPNLGINDQYILPFSALSLEDNPINHRKRSELYAKYFINKLNILPDQFLNTKYSKIRVGYFSADFHDHATMHLMSKIFILHDKEKFEIYAYSIGPKRDDFMRQNLIKAVDVFHDVSQMNDRDIAMLARQDEIDIAVDLKGYTYQSRTGIFAFRAAPIQINYLGYPGTMGADFIDYIIADKIIIPEELRDCYTEEVIYMPNSYQPNNNTRHISKKEITKSDVSLPENGFVFCSFNNNYKITFKEFDIWMNILKHVKGSVLWLLRSNQWAESNIKEEAKKRIVDPNRIIFADRVPHKEHLARHRLADLFLDTFNCNAHTTASDALWAGLPVVTKKGKGFAARVGASLLNAIDLPELITDNNKDYQLLILDLAKNPNKLKKIKEKLNKHRLTKPLFNSKQYTKNIEEGYKRAYQLYVDKKKKETIYI